jgi:ABC-type branched-subunit amino acid transport system substrate-binding protein
MGLSENSFESCADESLHRIGLPAALAYDAVKILAKVMSERGFEATNISEGLFATKDYQGASGEIAFGPDGTRTNRRAELWEFKGKTPQPLSK